MINIGIIGFGTVGTGAVRILFDNKDLLKERLGFDITLRKIAVAGKLWSWEVSMS